MAKKEAVPKKEARKKPERFTYTVGTVAEFVSGAHSEAETLGEEMREAYDNAPENLKGSDVNTRRDEAAGTLEGLSEPEVNDILGELEASYQHDNGKLYRGRMTESRAIRAANAAAKMNAAADAVRAWHEAAKKPKGVSKDDFEEAQEEAETLISECEDYASELESVDFPGMYG